MIVYLLRHHHYASENVRDTKILGVFDARGCCDEAIASYRKQPGFCEAPDDFEIEEHLVQGASEGARITEIFLVQHEFEDDEEFETVTFIGIFATKAKADRAVRAMKTDLSNRYAPNGFSVDRYPLNQRNWTEGYDTWR